MLLSLSNRCRTFAVSSLLPFNYLFTHDSLSIARHDVHHAAPRQVLARLGDVALQTRVGLGHVPERSDAEEERREGVEREAEENDRGELFDFFFFFAGGCCCRSGRRACTGEKAGWGWSPRERSEEVEETQFDRFFLNLVCFLLSPFSSLPQFFHSDSLTSATMSLSRPWRSPGRESAAA